MNKSNQLLSLIIIPSFLLMAGDNAGTTGFEFLRYEIGARPSATGGAFTAMQGDLHGLAYNPAALSGLTDKEITFTYINYLSTFQAGFLGFYKQLPRDLGIGISLAYLNYGDIPKTDPQGNQSGTFTSGDYLIHSVLAGSILPELVYGVGISYIASQYADYNSSAVAFDGGLNYHIEREQLNIGFSIRNLGKTIDAFIGEKQKLPLMYRAGISKGLAHLPMIFNVDLIRYQHENSSLPLGIYWAVGGEFSISEAFLLRWGYHSRGSEERIGTGDRLSGASFGFGIALKKFKIDVSHATYGVLGSVQTFSMTSHF